MLEKKELDDGQRQDLEWAQMVLEAAVEEDFSKWYGGDDTGLPEERDNKVVVIGDERDATSLENTRRAIAVMKTINELRAADDNYTGELRRNDAFTNFYFLAVAQSGAMRGAGLERHSLLQVSCEDLSFGYEDPTKGWYEEEKAAFDAIKEDLGIQSIDSEEGVEAVKNEAENRGVTVGHYTNLMWGIDQVMGVGYTPYGRYYGDTFCYNASMSSNYTESSWPLHMYTVDEFEALLNDYCATVDAERLRTALDAAEEMFLAADASLQQKQEAIQAAMDAAAEAMKELEAARTNEEAARNSISENEQYAAERSERLLEAQAYVQELMDELDAAEEAVTAAAELAGNAGTEAAMAEDALHMAEENRRIAENTVLEAERNVTEKKGILEVFAQTVDQAKEALEAAKTELQERYAVLEGMETAVQMAESEKEDADNRLNEAEAALIETRGATQERVDALAGAERALAAADIAVEEISARYSALTAVQSRMEAAATARTTAEQALDAARAALLDAVQSVSDKETALESEKNRLLQAQTLRFEDARVQPIDDEFFSYLNEYIDTVNSAAAEAEMAKKKLAEAQTLLEEKSAAYDVASEIYAEALAELVIAQVDYDAIQVGGNVNDNTVAENAVELEYERDEDARIVSPKETTEMKLQPARVYRAPHTGDESPIGFYGTLGTISLLLLGMVTGIRKRITGNK